MTASHSLVVLFVGVTVRVCSIHGCVTVGRVRIKARSLIAAIELVEPQALEELVLNRRLCCGLVKAAEQTVGRRTGGDVEGDFQGGDTGRGCEERVASDGSGEAGCWKSDR